MSHEAQNPITESEAKAICMTTAQEWAGISTDGTIDQAKVRKCASEYLADWKKTGRLPKTLAQATEEDRRKSFERLYAENQELRKKISASTEQFKERIRDLESQLSRASAELKSTRKAALEAVSYAKRQADALALNSKIALQYLRPAAPEVKSLSKRDPKQQLSMRRSA